jgi:type IV pilus assembly protein PilC
LREQIETGQSEQDVRERLVQQGLLVVSVKPRTLLGGGLRWPTRRRVKLEELVIYNQQFLTLIKAGLPILTSLELLLRRQHNPYFRALLEDVHNRVKSGEMLSEAFTTQGIFPKIYTTTLLAGEKSGNLEEVLARYIDFQRVALSVRKKLLASLIYPALLMLGVIVMLTFLVTFVIPRFAQLFEELRAQLPPLTTFMLTVGVTIRDYLPLIVGGFALLAFLVWRWRQTPSGARRVDQLRMAFPLLGQIWLRYQIGIFARMLSTLLSGGLPLVPALETAGGSLQSPTVARAVLDAAERVRQGSPLSTALEKTKAIPDLAVEMIEVGESTGALPPMLNSVAEFYEEDVQTALAAAMSLIEPIILVGMGVIVAFVLISLYLPIFSLGSGGIAH